MSRKPLTEEQKKAVAELRAKHGSLLNIALHFGFCTVKSTAKRKKDAMCRVSNWNKTGIPVRIMKRMTPRLEKSSL